MGYTLCYVGVWEFHVWKHGSSLGVNLHTSSLKLGLLLSMHLDVQMTTSWEKLVPDLRLDDLARSRSGIILNDAQEKGQLVWCETLPEIHPHSINSYRFI